MNRFYERIDTIDNIDTLSNAVCEEYNLGNFFNTTVIEIGYEDFNAIISTESGKYLMKVFRNSRDDEELLDCIQRTAIAGDNNLPTPKVYRNSKNEMLTVINVNNSRFRLALIDYINGLDYFNLKIKPSIEELGKIVEIASKLSKIDFKPPFIYDTWAIPSFCEEYEKKEHLLGEEEKTLVRPVYDEFKSFDYNSLPKAFVHGDMMSTNLMRDNNYKIWLIDFSVSNYTARLNEITVICDDVAMIVGNEEESLKRIKYVFDLWCEKVNATEFEINSFPLLFRVANAINVMNSTYEKITGNTSDETEMHLNVGKFGLSLNDELVKSSKC